jgi:hypothetical protein
MAGLGLLVLGGCGVALVALFMMKGSQATAPVAGIVGVVLGLPALAIALWSWAGRITQATADQVEQAQKSLAGWVRDQWRDEALARSLGDPEPMPVRWHLTEHAVMDRPRLITDVHLSFDGRSDRIGPLAVKFRQLRRRRLVILGDAGTGKTTLAVQLLLELLATRKECEPVPVLLSLAGWDPAEQPRLHDWLAERLADDYPGLPAFGPDVARALSEQGHILPILDGLDELPPARQPNVINALNASLTDIDQLVLTSRTQEYTTAIAEAHTVLTAAAVIEPEPLNPSEAADYLESCLPPDPDPSWCDLLDQLRAGTAEHLATVVATPLGLWLLRTVYLTPRADPRPLLNSEVARNAAALQAHLFDQLISAVLAARPATRIPSNAFRPRRMWHPAKVRRWLTYLAQHLDRTETRDLLWWHLARHTFTRSAFGLWSGLIAGMVTGLGSGLGVGLSNGPISGLTTGLVTGLGVGLPFGLVTRLVTVLGIGLLTGLATGLMTGLGVGLVTGMGVGLGVGLVAGPESGLVFGLVFGLLAGLEAGLVTGLVFGLGVKLGGQDWLTDEPAYANLRLKHRSGALVRDLGVGSGVGLVFGIVAGLLFGLKVEVMIGLAGGMGAGMVIGLLGGLVKWVGTPSRTGWASTPRSTYKATRALTVIQICVGGLGGGLVGVLVPVLVPVLEGRLVPVLTVGLGVGLGVGLVGGLGLMSSGAWFSYTLALCRLAATGHLPLQLMDFLDDAHRLGLLRTTGPAYQFRHAELHDHLIRTVARREVQ